jgi:hypothetical protein
LLVDGAERPSVKATTYLLTVRRFAVCQIANDPEMKTAWEKRPKGRKTVVNGGSLEEAKRLLGHLVFMADFGRKSRMSKITTRIGAHLDESRADKIRDPEVRKFRRLELAKIKIGETEFTQYAVPKVAVHLKDEILTAYKKYEGYTVEYLM